jgi:tetratricopeptide (TPR) repeat protein
MGIRDDLREAQRVIAQDPGPPQERYVLALRLGAANYFTHARKVLKQANIDDADEKLHYNIQRKLALFTYKDQDEPADDRLNEAQALLESLLLINPPQDDPDLRQDVFGILGAVHKRRWELDGKPGHLSRAFQKYEQGYKLGSNLRFYGYTAVNAAFVQDLQAEIEVHPLVPDTDGNRKKLHEGAESIRREVLSVLGDRTDRTGEDRYWDCVTLGEVYLGLGDYDRACEWTSEAARIPVENWMIETTARQIAQLARLQYRKKPEQGPVESSGPWRVVQSLLGGDRQAAASFLRGKVGLALSGGGFRASLFHIGVLAKLA